MRTGNGPVLLRLLVPRLSGHSGQDTQAYKSAEEIAAERARDPLAGLRQRLVPSVLPESAWQALEDEARQTALARRSRASKRSAARRSPSPATLFTRTPVRRLDRSADPGRIAGRGHRATAWRSASRQPEGARINMLTAIRRTLEHELAVNPRVLVFGEDVGRKGGVHAATLGLQERFGEDRVFDTSLSEEGIIGRAVGMALAGLMPVPEIQFRKYAEPAAEQLHDCGTIRWRTANRFAAPMVVRMPGGFFKCGDPWHSQCNEVQFLHATGWQLAMPSNAEDAVGLLRTALRGNDPMIFFEHRALHRRRARRGAPIPATTYCLPFGVARRLRAGSELTIVSWGAMVERCDQAAAESRRRRRAPGPAHARALGSRRRARVGAQDAPLPDRPRGQPDRGLRRRNRGGAGGTRLLPSRRAHRAPGDAGHPQSPQPGTARRRRAVGRRHRRGDPPHRESLMASSIDILLPADQAEGTRSQVLRWLKAVGQPVARHEPLVEIETDKVTIEVPAPADGVLAEITAAEGTDVAPGALLGRLSASDAAADSEGAPAAPAAAAGCRDRRTRRSNAAHA